MILPQIIWTELWTSKPSKRNFRLNSQSGLDENKWHYFLMQRGEPPWLARHVQETLDELHSKPVCKFGLQSLTKESIMCPQNRDIQR